MATSHAQPGPSSPGGAFLAEGTSILPPLPPPPPIPFRKPGPSILKQPPPPQPKFFSFSTFSKLLPNQQNNLPATLSPSDDGGKGIRGTPLKRAHFILPSLSTTYPIWSGNPPASPSLEREKADIEERERSRRARLVRGNSVSSLRSSSLSARSTPTPTEDFWSLEKVEQFYKECCQGREEHIDLHVVKAIKAAGAPPRSLVLSDTQLDLHASVALSDLLTIEWGLRKLVLKECNLDDASLKPILHTLLIPNSLSYLSLAGNKNLKNNAWRLVGVYLSKAVTLQFLDISQNTLDKRGIELIASSLGTIPPSLPPSNPASTVSTPTIESTEPRFRQSDKPQLVSLRLDECNLRPAALEALAHAVRNSPLQHISLRNNRIAPPGAVALALMIKDYPDTVPQGLNGSSSVPSSPRLPQAPLLSPPPTPKFPMNPSTAVRQSVIPPPSNQAPIAGTTYTPYVPRSKRMSAISTVTAPASPTVEREELQVPRFSTSHGGGITTRHLAVQSPSDVVSAATAAARNSGPSVALLDKVRALDNLPRLGALKTLDLRNNDLRTGISYISQVLKRNRTLKILNLSENKITAEGLVNIADALKYNTSLETLDLSRNPCCGPGVEGIASLRTAFTLNNSLKRLFLSSTGLTSDGAIMLAEFLPESASLLHLDLTQNELGMAGVMALSNGLKANETMRCLDLNIPPGDEEMARLCREILNWCVRNTERADARARSEGAHSRGRGVWGMIEDSALARAVRKGETKMIETDVVVGAHEVQDELERVAEAQEAGVPSIPSDVIALINRAKATLPALVAAIEASNDPNKLEEMLLLNDALTELIKKVESAKPLRPSLVTNGLSNGSLDRLSITSSGTGTPSISAGFLSPSLNPITSLSSLSISGEDDDDLPLTPRLDKGKGKAVHHEEPEHEFVNENGKIIPEPGSTADENIGSPTDSRSRIWVEEEGEVFRKGVALLTPEKMEDELGDYAGDDLRIELLETEVERAPARILDMDGDGDPIPENEPPMSPPAPRLKSPQMP